LRGEERVDSCEKWEKGEGRGETVEVKVGRERRVRDGVGRVSQCLSSDQQHGVRPQHSGNRGFDVAGLSKPSAH
jgi:hypothetical protein